MAPKKEKGQKMSLGSFLADTTTGGSSWADDMDDLPSAPSLRADGDRPHRGGDDFSRGFDRDRSGYPPREELPLPTKAPWNAFMGNLSFDVGEDDVHEFFAPHKVLSVKIIRDHDDKPKGFGYVEFETLEGLKEALSRSGKPLGGRPVRLGVAEPPKERFGSSGGGFDDSKFDKAWRRDGPLPDRGSDERRGSSRPSRFGGGGEDGGDRFGSRGGDGPTNEADDWRSTPRPVRAPMPEREPPSRRASTFATTSMPEGNEPDQWRSNKPLRVAEPPSSRPRSGFATPVGDGGAPSAADLEETWTKGSKFKPSSAESPPLSESGRRGFRDGAPSRQSSTEEPSDWRSVQRKTPLPRNSSFSDRPVGTSAPPTPMSRKRLELLPRSSNSPSANSSPLASPALSPTGLPSMKPNPFGDAKPIDASTREKEVEEKLAKEHQTRTEILRKPKEEKEKFSPGHSRQPSAGAPAPAPAPAPAGNGSTEPSEPTDGWRRKREDKPAGGHSRQPSFGAPRNGNASRGSPVSRGSPRAQTPPKESPKITTTPPTPEAPRFTSNMVKPSFSFAAAAAKISIDEEGPEDVSSTSSAATVGEIDMKPNGTHKEKEVEEESPVDTANQSVASSSETETLVETKANEGEEAPTPVEEPVEEVANGVVNRKGHDEAPEAEVNGHDVVDALKEKMEKVAVDEHVTASPADVDVVAEKIATLAAGDAGEQEA